MRYADNTIILAESEQQLQHMIDKLDATKTVIVDKTPEKQCEVNVKGQRHTHVKQCKYLGTTVEHTGQCKTEVAQRINQAKIAFWKKATILRSNISMKTRIIILMCYVFSVVSYGCETWTFSRAIDHKINSSVLRTICVKETTMLNNLKTAGHIMTNTSGHRDTLLATIED